jgi:hypothetical protein
MLKATHWAVSAWEAPTVPDPRSSETRFRGTYSVRLFICRVDLSWW